MRNRTGSGFAAHSILVLSTLASAGALAQQSPPTAGALDEIIVSARRVEENLQRTPVAVSAFQSVDIEERSIQRIGDTAAFTPNFVTSSGPTGQNDGYYFVRGVGQTDLNPSVDPAVATYIDGVYLGRIMGSSFDTTDLERIEVLRGPQGTLFGRNTMGGAVSAVTRDPGNEFSARVKLFGGNRDLYGGKVSMDVPLADDLSLGLSGMYKNQDGWGKRSGNATTSSETLNSAETYAGRAKLVYKPSGTFSATLSLDGSHVDGTSEHQILTGFNPAASSPLGVPIVPGIGDFVQTGPGLVNTSSVPDPKYQLSVWGTSLTLDWQLDGMNLKSITAYRNMESFSASDFDGSPYTFYDQFFDTRQDQFSQELQLTGEHEKLSWLLGAFYYNESDYHNNGIDLGGNNGCLPVPAFAIPPGNPYPSCFDTGTPYATAGAQLFIRNNQQFNLDINAYALFAHSTYHFTDRWSASAGLRWTSEKKEQKYNFFIDNTLGVANFAGLPPFIIPTLSPNNPFLTIPTTYSKTWSRVTPALSVEFQATDDILTYLSYSEGFKSGGFKGRPNPGATGAFAEVQPFEPEKLDTIELGMKSQFADDRVRLNLALFYSDYKDIQLLVLNPATGFFDTANASATIKGAEVEMVARPVGELQIQLTGGYADSNYSSVPAGSNIPSDGVLPVTPKYTFSTGVQYTFFLPQASSLAVRADYNWRDSVYYGATNNPGEYQGSFGLLNLRSTWTASDSRLDISVYGRNVTDERYFSNGQDVTGPLGVSFAGVGATREYGLEAGYRFGK